MNILTKISNAFKDTKSYYMPGVQMIIGGAFNWNYKSKNSQLKGYENKIVYATVNVLVKKLIETPIIVSKIKSEKDLLRIKSFNPTNNEQGKLNVLKIKALEEMPEHPLNDLLNNPNDYQIGKELLESFWFNYELTGDGFLFVEKNGDKPVFLHSLNPDRISLYREGNDWRKPVTKYVFNAWDGTSFEIPIEDLLHLKKWSPLDALQGGWSPMQSVGGVVSKNDEKDLAEGSAFKNGGTGTIIGSDILVHEGKSYSKLSVEQVQSIKETILTDYAGARNNGKIHVTNGTVNVQKYGDTLVDLNTINADNQDAIRISAAWGVDSCLIGDKTGGTENNVKAAYKALVTNTVVPELRKFDAKFKQFSKTWYRGERLDISHDLTEFSELAPDLKLMKDIYGGSWQISGNEFRRIVNMETSDNPNMDKFLVPAGLMDLDSLMMDDFNEIPPNNGEL